MTYSDSKRTATEQLVLLLQNHRKGISDLTAFIPFDPTTRFSPPQKPFISADHCSFEALLVGPDGYTDVHFGK